MAHRLEACDRWIHKDTGAVVGIGMGHHIYDEISGELIGVYFWEIGHRFGLQVRCGMQRLTPEEFLKVYIRPNNWPLFDHS